MNRSFDASSLRLVVLCVFDTLRKDAVGAYGATPWGPIRTPRLDAFARSSTLFTEAYPESLPTLPARRAIYTGQRTYPFHNGDFRLKGDFVPAPGWGPIPEDQATLAEIMSEAGWRTGLVSDLYHQFKPSKNFWRGFDQWTFVRGQEADPARSGPLPTAKEIDYWCPPELGIPEPQRTDLVSRCVANMTGRSREEDWTSAIVFREAAQWVEQNLDADRMFLTVECFDPHEPWFVPEKYRDVYGEAGTREQVFSPYAEVPNLPDELLTRTRANYSSLVTMVDKWFGHLVDAVDSLCDSGQVLFIVTSDHGHTIGETGYIGKRGYPSRPETIDLPLFVRMPGEPDVPSRCSDFVQHHDIAPFILDVAGVTSGPVMDGRSFVGSLCPDGERSPRQHVTIGWGSAMTVVDSSSWFNCKVNGAGSFLYDRTVDPALNEVEPVEDPDTASKMFRLGCADARGGFPDYLLDLARNVTDAPGCSSVAART